MELSKKKLKAILKLKNEKIKNDSVLRYKIAAESDSP
jgi:hypothetical protein